MKIYAISAIPLIVLGTGTACARSATDPAVDAILAGNRAAVGDPSPASMLSLVYDYQGSGLVGSQTGLIDLTTGAYVDSMDASGVSEGNGFDGTTPWQRDVSGAYTAQQGGDRIPTAIDSAYWRANRWWLPDHGGAVIARLSNETSGERILEGLSVTPKDGKRFEAWFDAKTHLLAKIAYDVEFLHKTESYSDYRHEGPQMLAHRIEVDLGLGKGAVTNLTLTHCDYRPAEPLGTYSQPHTPLVGAEIVGGASSTRVPFRLLNNHVYVDATVNGKGPYTFIVDTGGHTLLSPHLIEQVGLKTVGNAVTSGAGEGHGTTGFVRFEEIAIGGVRLREQVGFATDIYDKAIEGIPVDGMLGFELIRRMVTTIDYDHHTITFTDPDRFRPGPESGEPVPFVFYDHLPYVTGRIEKVPARFDIDTGSRSELDITSPFVEQQQLRARFPKATLAVTGYGVGGPARAYVVRMSQVTIGNVSIQGPVVGLSDARGGTFSDPNFDANVGSALLKRFVVTFDYAHQMLYLKRIEPVPADVGTFDRSGLWINAHGNAYQIVDIAHDSAASRAGLQIGDLLIAENKHPVTDAGLSDMRQVLRSAPPGTKIEFTVRRGPDTISVTLILRDQL